MPPPVPDFSPEKEGWIALREPNPLWLNLLALPFSLLAVVVLAAAWGREPTASIDFATSAFGRIAPLVWIPSILVGGFAGLVVVHESLHALGYPRCGWTQETVLGVWPSRLVFFAAYEGAMQRNRWLFVYLLPITVLSVLPVTAYRVFGLYHVALHLVSLLNALFSGGDLFGVLLILFQVPRNAKLRNHGWATWWKIDEGSAPPSAFNEGKEEP